MATATELMGKSRVGGVRGINGNIGMQKTFLVTVDNEGEDPVRSLTGELGTIQDENGRGVRLESGTEFDPTKKWKAQGAVATEFVVSAQLSPTQFEVVVLYSEPLVVDQEIDWNVRISGSLETEDVVKDIDDRTIGRSVYAKQSDDITSCGFNTQDTYTVAVDSTTKADPCTKIIKLHRHNSRMQHVAARRTKKTGTVTLSKTVPNVTPEARASIFDMMNTVNAQSFLGARPEQLKFIEGEVYERPGFVPGVADSSPGKIYDVSLTWSWNPVGWNKDENARIYHMWEEKGLQYPILDPSQDNEHVFDQFKLYEKENHGAFLRRFDRKTSTFEGPAFEGPIPGIPIRTPIGP